MSRRKIITERDIRRAIKHPHDSVNAHFIMQINHESIDETLPTSDDALAFQMALEKYFRNGRVVVPSDYKVSDLFQIYQDKKPDKSKRYYVQMRQAVNLLTDTIGDKELRHVTTDDSDRFRVAMVKRKRQNGHQISGYRVNGYMTMLRSAFHMAERKGAIPRGTNPFKEYIRTEVLRSSPVIYTPKTYRIFRDKFVEVFGEDYGMMMDLFLLTGARDSEWTDTEWDWINLREQTLVLPPEYTKTSYERKVPLADPLVTRLRNLQSKGYARPIPFSSSEVSHRWTYIRTGKRTNKPDITGVGIPGTLHSLRKTVESELMAYNLNSEMIDGLLGHLPESVAEKYYLNQDRVLPTIRKYLERMARNFKISN